MRVSYTIRITPTEEGGYTVTVPALPGCITEGWTVDEVKINAEEAILGYLELLLEDGRDIPIEESTTTRNEGPFEITISVTI